MDNNELNPNINIAVPNQEYNNQVELNIDDNTTFDEKEFESKLEVFSIEREKH